MNWVSLGFEIALTLARAIVSAIQAGDASILDKPVRELLGPELATTLAKKVADAKAHAKFGEASIVVNGRTTPIAAAVIDYALARSLGGYAEGRSPSITWRAGGRAGILSPGSAAIAVTPDLVLNVVDTGNA
ncbi:hypothetical protein [Sandaracinus amylolyticus]|uniref:hypothetical protein n=1 Tax=Sandaracinus amylolyticus TaxID=927083 RepID=UPI001F3B6C0A|nr:hypothetical protein [Sandaracinus amylolyticus]UJR81503.1 Hypothetical protein I5071_35630 [Sandaracinus amylolyticus]